MKHNTNLFKFISQDIKRTSAIHFNLFLFLNFLWASILVILYEASSQYPRISDIMSSIHVNERGN